MTHGHDLFPGSQAGHLTHWFRRLLHPPGMILRGYISRGDTVLDLGCGPGYFSLPMARMVGEQGMVIAVDVQEEMLARLRAAAEREGLTPRFRFHRSLPGSLGLDIPPIISFALAFHVLHETDDPDGIFAEIHRVLRSGGLLLIAEPVGVVGAAEFRQTGATAARAGFTALGSPRILLSRTILLRKDPPSGGSSSNEFRR